MKNKLEITRVFNAPVAKFWDIWTKTENIVNWWGPVGFTTKVIQNDFKPGGKWKFIMIDAEGKEYPAVGIFQEIELYKKITSTDEFGEDFHETTDLDLPKILLFTALFEDHGDKTKLTLIYEHPTPEDLEKHITMGVDQGWNSSLDKLEKYIAKGY